jgi:hypothetical protein
MVPTALLGTRSFLGTHYIRPIGTFAIVVSPRHKRDYIPNVHQPRRICPATAIYVVAATGDNPDFISDPMFLDFGFDNAALGNLVVHPRYRGTISPKNPFVSHYESTFEITLIPEARQLIHGKI